MHTNALLPFVTLCLLGPTFALPIFVVKRAGTQPPALTTENLLLATSGSKPPQDHSWLRSPSPSEASSTHPHFSAQQVERVKAWQAGVSTKSPSESLSIQGPPSSHGHDTPQPQSKVCVSNALYLSKLILLLSGTSKYNIARKPVPTRQEECVSNALYLSRS